MMVVDAVIVSLLGAVFLLLVGMAWRVPRAIHQSADDTVRGLGAKIDATNSIVSDIQERVVYLESRADPPPRAA